MPGHFPGRPVVPGVVLLDHVMQAAQAAGLAGAGPGATARLPAAKFLRPVGPEEEVELTLRRTATGRLAFAGSVAGTPAFQGELA
nr:hypothetical protein [Pararoseomonas indoligenes]